MLVRVGAPTKHHMACMRASVAHKNDVCVRLARDTAGVWLQHLAVTEATF